MIWRLVAPAVTSRRSFTSDKRHRVDLYIAEHQGAMVSAHAIVFPAETRAMEMGGCGTIMRPIDGSFAIEAGTRGMYM